MSSLALAFACLAACAPTRSAGVTTTTAADVPTSADAEAKEASSAPIATAGAATGDVVCRATDAFGVTSELRVAWRGKDGEGTLRQLTPSGMTSETRIRAEREGDVIFADDVKAERDLLVHAASVTRKDGKGYLRLGGPKQPWSACE